MIEDHSGASDPATCEERVQFKLPKKTCLVGSDGSFPLPKPHIKIRYFPYHNPYAVLGGITNNQPFRPNAGRKGVFACQSETGNLPTHTNI